MKIIYPISSLLLLCTLLLAGCNKTEDDVEQRLLTWEAPLHPYLAANGASNVHNDAYMTDVYQRKGPAKDNLNFTTTVTLNRVCITIAFDRQGRIMTLGTGGDGKRAIYLLNAITLEILDKYELPAAADLGVSGAGYFYLNNNDQMVVPTTNKHIYQFVVVENKFVLQTDYDLTSLEDPCHLASVMPDWNGNLWFVTTEGVAGIVKGAGSIEVIQLTHTDSGTEVKEAIDNSFAVDETGGVFVVTDYAIYRLEANESKQPKIIWREEYDRGTQKKPGQFAQGSGTTPTLISDDFLAITDNAEPRMNVLVYKRKQDAEGERLVCKVPVFRENASATENSLIAWHNSIIVENNYGYTKVLDFVGKLSEPGMTRIDFYPDGNYDVVWESDIVVPSLISKYSSGNSTIYTYTKQLDGWYLTLLDMNSGAVKFQTKTGGDEYWFNNHYSGIAIGPDGSAYIPCAGGIIRFSE
jgi:hypothetical protein